MGPVGAPPSCTDPDPARARRRLLVALAFAIVGGAVIGTCQRDYYNADFVAYATIAHRTLAVLTGELPNGEVVAGYWAPLYSWLMVPLLALGASDLLAGRLVLIAAGLGYITAVDRLLRNLRATATGRDAVATARGEFVHAAVLTGATVQGTLWAEYLLDPDLLGAMFSLATFATLVGGGPAPSQRRCLGIGALAGAAYLGKSFQLPFLAVMVPLGLWWLPARGDTPPPAWRTVLRAWAPRALFAALGALLIAGPWLALLARRYGRLTISTAGPANHANVGPGVRGLDLLWTPPLEPAYILDPHLGPDWSPFASWQHFLHQAMLVVVNLGHACALLGGPCLLLVLAAIARRQAVRREVGAVLPAGERVIVRYFGLAAVVFVLGYASIQVGRRYLLATVTPLLCLCGFTLLGGAPRWLARLAASARAARWLPVLLALVFAGQELRLLWVTATRHPQSGPYSTFAALAAALRSGGLAERRFAADLWHEGLSATYALGAVDRYYGTPLGSSPAERSQQLTAAGVDCYLQFRAPADPEAEPPLPAPWQHAMRAAPPGHGGAGVDVYVRDR